MSGSITCVPVVAQQPERGPRFSPWRAAGWLTLLATVAGIVLTAYMGWRWLDSNIFSIGIEDAGTVTVNEAELIESIRSFELVTVKNSYDASSNTDFKKRLNAGFTKIALPGWIAGQELDVEAEVTVAAGVDLNQVRAEDIEIIKQGSNSVVVVRIPEAQITSTEVNAETFDISTGSGLLTKVRGGVGLGNRDVRDGALEQVTAEARRQALDEGILAVATREARARLQAFLQGLPQTGDGSVVYLVEVQAPLPQ